jgi:hypothetical protein
VKAVKPVVIPLQVINAVYLLMLYVAVMEPVLEEGVLVENDDLFKFVYIYQIL